MRDGGVDGFDRDTRCNTTHAARLTSALHELEAVHALGSLAPGMFSFSTCKAVFWLHLHAILGNVTSRRAGSWWSCGSGRAAVTSQHDTHRVLGMNLEWTPMLSSARCPRWERCPTPFNVFSHVRNPKVSFFQQRNAVPRQLRSFPKAAAAALYQCRYPSGFKDDAKLGTNTSHVRRQAQRKASVVLKASKYIS